MKVIGFGAVTALALLCSAPAFAQASFNGTWKIDEAATQLPAKPSVWKLGGGKFTCGSCTPAFTIPADGAFHPVSGNPYIDSVSATVISPTEAKVAFRKGEKINGEETRTVSADGKKLTMTGVDYSAPDGSSFSYTDTAVRVADGAKGEHALSGSWKRDTLKTNDDKALLFTFAVEGDNVTYTTPTGERLAAKVGGPAAAWEKDPAGRMSTVTRVGDNGLRIVDMVKGEKWSTIEMATTPDGKTMNVTVHNERQKTETKSVAHKQ